MPTTNERKHVIPAGGDASFSRATIFEAFGNSIHDVIPVANATERAQVVSNLVAAGQGPSSANPLVVIRADAPGLRRVEYTSDGSVWLPASGVLSFTTKADADSWGAANGGLLTAGDRSRVSGVEYLWTGTAWQVAPRVAAGSVACPATGGGSSAPIFWSDLIDVTFPAGVFTAAPDVHVQTVGPAGQVSFGGLVEQITATGCKVRGMRIGSVPNQLFSVQWQAVQAS